MDKMKIEEINEQLIEFICSAETPTGNCFLILAENANEIKQVFTPYEVEGTEAYNIGGNYLFVVHSTINKIYKIPVITDEF